MKHRTTLLLVLATLLASASGAAAKPQLEPRVKPLTTDRMGPFVLTGGTILTIDGTEAFVSKDGGATWSAGIPMFAPGQKAKISNERAFLRTKKGTIILAFLNLETRGKTLTIRSPAGKWQARRILAPSSSAPPPAPR